MYEKASRRRRRRRRHLWRIYVVVYACDADDDVFKVVFLLFDARGAGEKGDDDDDECDIEATKAEEEEERTALDRR